MRRSASSIDFGDIDTSARHEEGLYHEGTRFLSRLTLTLAGGRPLLLSATSRRDNLLIAADLTNPDIYLDGRVILPRGSLHLYRTKLIWQDVCYECLHVRNFIARACWTSSFPWDSPRISPISSRCGAQKRPRRGRLLEPAHGAGFVELAYEGLDLRHAAHAYRVQA